MAELIVTLVLLGIIGGAVIQVLARQQRFYGSVNDVLDMRGRIRQAGGVVPADLRAISPTDTISGQVNSGDIYQWSDHAIEFRAMNGSTVVCWVTAAAPLTTLRLPPLGLANVLTNWQAQPIIGDSLLIYDNGASIWRAYAITAFTPVTGAAGCPTGAGQLLTDATLTSYAVTVSPALSASIATGAPVRVFRRAHYELYQETDGRWYLGFFDCPVTCGSLAPVSGPYRAYSAVAGQSGLVFAYYDSTGAVLTPGVSRARNIARIDLTVRAQTQSAVSVSGAGTRATAADSMRYSIGLRNRY